MSDTMLADVLAELKRANELLTEQIRNTRLTARWQADGVIRQILKEPRYGIAKRLEHNAYRIFSENGEDGMIQEIFRRIGTHYRPVNKHEISISYTTFPISICMLISNP